jgi:hypothetical protein
VQARAAVTIAHRSLRDGRIVSVQAKIGDYFVRPIGEYKIVFIRHDNAACKRADYRVHKPDATDSVSA